MISSGLVSIKICLDRFHFSMRHVSLQMNNLPNLIHSQHIAIKIYRLFQIPDWKSQAAVTDHIRIIRFFAQHVYLSFFFERPLMACDKYSNVSLIACECAKFIKLSLPNYSFMDGTSRLVA